MSAVLSDTQRRAAHGKHRCELCRQPIEPGEVYRDARFADDGTAWTWREHIRCGDFLAKAWGGEPWRYDEYDSWTFVEECNDNPELAREFGVPGY